jgi:hypothetical protein
MSQIKKLSDITEKIILKSLEKNSQSYSLTYKLGKSWNDIVGSKIALMVKVSEVKDNGEILLKLHNNSYGLEINSYKQLIIERINMHLGKDYISKVVIIT